jgi:acylphosphatase
MKKAAKFLIKGTVQGVFFRQFCKDKADFFSLKGYVRNVETGEVEVYVEGEQDNIEKFYQNIKQGPPHAQIREIKIEEKKWTGDLKEFSIMRF